MSLFSLVARQWKLSLPRGRKHVICGFRDDAQFLECSSEFTNKLKGGSTSACILFSAALGMYSTRNTMLSDL
ncbi:hypothetical protein Scep_019675 [Stephania cephalantha]|uniref:Uncharacterized protein n=1 Tax=Stephania cephalantha TaxID=152367 RepID=A0AAP0IC69_9MAGN